MSKYRYVSKTRLRDYLLDNGFKFENMQRDLKNPKRYVWKFLLTPELQQAIEEYYSSIPTK